MARKPSQEPFFADWFPFMVILIRSQHRSRANSFERGEAPAPRRLALIHLFHGSTRAVHREAHRTAHGPQRREIRGVGQVFLAQDEGKHVPRQERQRVARPVDRVEPVSRTRDGLRGFVPRASVDARPPEHIEVSTLGCFRARRRVPLAAVRASPLQDFEVSALGDFSRTSRRSTGIRSRAPTSKRLDALPPPRSRTCSRPTRSRSRAPT